jgi:hypothetical protein
MPTSTGHQRLGDLTIADASRNRLLHGAHLTALNGESLRWAMAQA